MEKAQYAIMRFAKYKGPEIGNIEAHNERTKEKYASNPDVDTSRSRYNFHLVKPPGKYRAEAERQKIEVFAPDKSSGKRMQKVKIYFNFVDDVEIPVISEPVVSKTTYGRRKTA